MRPRWWDGMTRQVLAINSTHAGHSGASIWVLSLSCGHTSRNIHGSNVKVGGDAICMRCVDEREAREP